MTASTTPATGTQPVNALQPFHRKGLAYFWIFNDRCEWETLNRQLEAFAAAEDVTAVCIHPRNGLLLPYGGSEWFEMVQRVCRRAAELDLKVWLYDEDPFPSGNAGGRIVAEHPEYAARGLQLFTYDPQAQGDTSLFCFPTGTLIWCGLVNEETAETIDLTDRVGVVRRKWEIFEQWDSRFFYPDTPLYSNPRCEANQPEFALTVPDLPAGMKLVAVVARQAAFSAWSPYGDFIDSLNPQATQLYINYTHERYLESVGEMFGNEIEAIFTDEPKFYDAHPWTPGLFEDFQREMGYDIRPYLHYLFGEPVNERACLTKLHYRYFAGERFRTAWLQPVAAWCREHNVKLIGHISPEDDPVEQAMCLCNLLPNMKEFDLCGIDIIIPAFGDHRHPLLNIGVTCATSIAQQQFKQGVMTETGHGCINHSAPEVGKIFLWQSIMGVTTPLIHCAFTSTRGPREYEKPDFGPDSSIWEGMHDVRRQLAAVQQVTHGARQVAPVAILWPIRSFNLLKFEGMHDPTGLRREFTDLLAACLDRQVGTHVIDEADLADVRVADGQAILGRARYTHILIPSTTVLHAETIARLQALQAQGIRIILAGRAPQMLQGDGKMLPADMNWCTAMSPEDAVSTLPRLLELPDNAVDIRCTAWESGDSTTRLLMNLGAEPYTAKIDEGELLLEPGVVQAI